MPTTRIVIRNDGKVFIEGIDYIGDECLNDLRKLQELLRSYGIEIDILEQRKKSEAYIASQVAVHG